MARPVLVVAPRSTATPESVRRTAYEPGDALSSACEKCSVRAAGLSPTAPVTGRIGMSPNDEQPPEKWSRLKPRIASSVYW